MSAESWNEVKRLAADFQRAQLISTVQRLSERNCIEIVKKLIESKLIEVIFTNDGSEYLTPNRLLKEIRDEVYVHGGRVNLVDIAQTIGVDFNHVEAKAGEFLNSEPHTCMVLGQIITREYLDHMAEEINEKLHQSGQITIAEIAKFYDLPGNFLEQVLHHRLGTLIQGQVDSSDSTTFFTESFIAQHTSKIRGVLSALTRPVPVASLVNRFKFPEKLFFRVAEDLIKEGRLSGSISGGKGERSVFVPDIYAKSQNELINSFYKQNNYLEYDAVSRLGVQEPKNFLKKMLREEELTFLSTCCVGQSILGQIETAIEEALQSKTYVDVLPLLPSMFSPEDCQGIIATVTKSVAKMGSVIHVYCDAIVVSDELLKACRDSFEPLMEAKAKEDIAKSPHLFVVSQSSRGAPAKRDKEQPPSKGKQDRKEDKKKKTSSSRGSGAGSQGRETKTKAVKKKYFTGREADDEVEEEEAGRVSSLELEFMSTSELEEHLKKLPTLEDCPEELLNELSSELHRSLTRRYRQVAKLLYEASVASSGSNRRKQHADCQERFSTLLAHITMFEKAAKLFPEDVSSQLYKHLQRTLCTDLTNSTFLYLAQEHGLPSSTETETLVPEQRQKMLNKFPEEVKQPLTKLHNSLSAKTLEDFLSSIDTVLGAGICDMIIRKMDKKKERLILQNHRQSLLLQLSEASDPALCLHLTTLLLFQAHTHAMLHASGKFVPHVVTFLKKQVPLEIYQLLATYQESVMRKLTPSGSDEETTANESALQELLPRIKDIATTYRKTSVSESEN